MLQFAEDNTFFPLVFVRNLCNEKCSCVKGIHLEICKYLRLQMNIICWRSYIKTPHTFWDMRTWDMWKVCLRTFRNNRICFKLAFFLRNLLTSRVNNSRIFRIKNVKFSGYCFHINTNRYEDLWICISVPLSQKQFKVYRKTVLKKQAFLKNWPDLTLYLLIQGCIEG